MTVERVRTYRGISERAARHYLTRVGGELNDDGTVRGDGWRATVSSELVGVGPTLELTEVTVAFEGDAETLEGLIERFSQKAIRAGG
jgi:hypothetical protein